MGHRRGTMPRPALARMHPPNRISRGPRTGPLGLGRWIPALGLPILACSLPGCFLFRSHEVGQLNYRVSRLAPADLARKAEEADALYREPRTPERVEKSYLASLDSISPANRWQGLWHAARAAVWLAERLSDEDRRKAYARKAVAAAREAVRRNPERVESHYYLCLCLAQFSSILRSPKFIREMASVAETTLRKDERFDRAGAHRFLGLLNLRCEGIAFLGFGDFDRAIEHLRRAVDLFPEDAENRLAYVEALIKDDEFDAARRELDAALASKPPPDYQQEHAEWLLKAKGLKEEIGEK